MTDELETHMRNLHEIEHALFYARNSREKYLTASQYDTHKRESFSRELTRTSFSYVCHGLKFSYQTPVTLLFSPDLADEILPIKVMGTAN